MGAQVLMRGLSPISATVTNVSSEIIAANTNRVGLVICNTGSQDVYLSCDVSPAVVGAGICLRSGENVSILPPHSQPGPIYAIATNPAGVNLAMQAFE